MRVLIWVQHLLGSGHLRRALTLAGALAGQGHGVTLVTGGMPIAWKSDAAIDIVQLPPLRAADARFRSLLDHSGQPVSAALMARRQAKLLATFDACAPDIVLVEMFPFGRGSLRNELVALLEAAKARRPRPVIASSVRDILVGKNDARKQERMLDFCNAFFDLVLVHADPNLVRFEESFHRAGELRARLAYTGYVVEPFALPPSTERDEILVTVGGGAVGGNLLRASLAASRLTTDDGRRWRLVLGTNLAEREALDLQRQAPGETIIDRHHESLVPHLMRAAVSVSQAGYNTVVECLATGAPMVLVPFGSEGEDEQSRRAARLEGLGLANVVQEQELTPEALVQAVRSMLTRQRPSVSIDLDGAANTVRLLEQALRS
ncbi:Predicted glycosyl transferase [Arboricoccus pini]|uniref:Predicted glycosyl transferase n=1 Tax=Arboricoccus pini TaxID=1963835 RepID=A0A212Q1S0_9PROT|nr:glycosyltransferase [Arboricoccus pini]SNB53108.1 Predicted glycosyl transferase [Arboricoccus pini]